MDYISTTKKRAFYRDLRLVFDQHPAFAGRVALAEIPASPECEECVSPVLGIKVSESRSAVCVKWGIDPVTGKRVCLQYAAAI